MYLRDRICLTTTRTVVVVAILSIVSANIWKGTESHSGGSRELVCIQNTLVASKAARASIVKVYCMHRT